MQLPVRVEELVPSQLTANWRSLVLWTPCQSLLELVGLKKRACPKTLRWLLMFPRLVKPMSSPSCSSYSMWRLINADCSTCSLSVLLSAMEMICKMQTGLMLAWRLSSTMICICVWVPCILPAATVWGQLLVCSELLDCVVMILRVATIQRWHLIEEIH